MTTIPIVWPISGGYQLLELPPNFTDFDDIYPESSSADGSVIIGWSDTSNGYVPCRWDNGVLTILTGPDADTVYPYMVSQDGSIVLGDAGNNKTAVRWTTPTNGTALPPLAGTTLTSSYSMSDDGSIMVGTCYNFDPPTGTYSTVTNTVWVNGVPNSWGLVSDSYNASMNVCSGDGLTIAGAAGFSPFLGPVGYWRSHTFYPLTSYPPPADNYTGRITYCNGNGTVLYGYAYDAYSVFRQCYWDNLTSVTGSADFGSGVVSTYGTMHILTTLGGSGQTNGVAQTGNMVVGSGNGYAAKWVNGVFTNLQPNPTPPGVQGYGKAYGCSGDGSIVVGSSLVGTDRGIWACYWNTANVQHMLPRVTEYPAWGSDAYGISRDGTLIYGVAYVDTSVWWNIAGNPTGAFGDLWSDSSFMDFSDSTVRGNFISPDNTWLSYYGPQGRLYLTAQWNLDPRYPSGYFILDVNGNDPTTGQPYAAVSFDSCGPLRLISLYPFDAPTSAYDFTATSDLDSTFTQFSISVWCCKNVHIQSPSTIPSITLDFAPHQIVIAMHGVDGSLRFSGTWTVLAPIDEYQVLFSIDTVARTYSLYVNDTVPSGTPTWGIAGPIGWA